MKKIQPTLKLGCALVMASALLFALPAGQSVQGKTGNKLTATAAIKVSVTIHIGRNSRNCTGFGVCKVTISASTASKRAVNGELSTTDDGKLTLALLGKAPDETQTLILDEDVPVPAEAAKKLGLGGATLLKGQYAFNASRAVLSARLIK
ncbi:MAG: hypothetical protein ACREAB_06635 [Blastocatellia bacterium]